MEEASRVQVKFHHQSNSNLKKLTFEGETSYGKLRYWIKPLGQVNAMRKETHYLQVVQIAPYWNTISAMTTWNRLASDQKRN